MTHILSGFNNLGLIRATSFGLRNDPLCCGSWVLHAVETWEIDCGLLPCFLSLENHQVERERDQQFSGLPISSIPS